MIRCLLVRSGDQVYAIDAACLDESPAAANGDLPLLPLGSLLGSEILGAGPENVVIVWHSPATAARVNGTARYRIGFDGIVGRQETLVRSLGRHAPRWPGLCGAAELMDGRIALVLDLGELIQTYFEAKADSGD